MLEGRGAPLVAVGAEDAGAVGVVEQDELADELVLIGSDLVAEDAEVWIAVAFLDVAEDLIVGAILLDDVDDVLDEARFADALGNWRAAGWSGRGGSAAWAMAPRRMFLAARSESLSRSALFGIGRSETLPW